MVKLTAPFSQDIISLYNEYTHNIPVIYSIIEGQYDGAIYVDNVQRPGYAILATPFMYFYMAGNPHIPGIAEEIDILLFKEILPAAAEKEVIVFSPSEAWDKAVKPVFDNRHGLSDGRRIFKFDLDKFNMARNKYAKTPEGVRQLIKEIDDDPASRISYPSSQIWRDGICVSACSALMTGAGFTELDISTHPDHQCKGYATYAAITLIDELLNRNLIPCWSTWPYREASQAVAQKVGFVRDQDVLAYIWTEQNT